MSRQMEPSRKLDSHPCLIYLLMYSALEQSQHSNMKKQQCLELLTLDQEISTIT